MAKQYHQTNLLVEGLADRMVDDIISKMTELGMSHEQQRHAAIALMVQHTLQQLQHIPQRYRELFLVLLTEAVLKDDLPADAPTPLGDGSP
ncbi:hypothetical protein IQ265_12730 [Nodosilinea sp. LEGE 06152]|uniref:hypothetical protein n=1 Tax=Nodosilinea sp. LEGE 06152 TaxID=2777966 RepID=UPI00187E5D0E|nr:hypothetical protein [Nodosilinea sp. LEGE 06152]MBE9157684.1 hypothetical protein [Nodosilinea sp. LEGE 06152]